MVLDEDIGVDEADADLNCPTFHLFKEDKILRSPWRNYLITVN